MSSYTHGMGHTPECHAYHHMKQRCYNPNDPAYKSYGGRGIKVCESWLKSFENFYADLGPRPTAIDKSRNSQFSLERFDNNGNYEPENCGWITMADQLRNRRYSTNIDSIYFSYHEKYAIKWLLQDTYLREGQITKR